MWKLIIVVLTCLIITSSSITLAQTKREPETRAKVITWVDWDCLTLKYPKRRLNRLVRTEMENWEGPGVWGDRAFAYDLNGDRNLEYFIPLRCGATGNCGWGVFALAPARLIGVLFAENIYIRKRVGRWSALTAYIQVSASDGLITNYVFRNDKYVKLPVDYQVSGYYNLAGFRAKGVYPFPKFMETISSPCASKKSKRTAQ